MPEPVTAGEAIIDDAPVWAYVASFVVYVVLGYFFTSVVLNWIVGPLWLVATLHLLPRALGLDRRGAR